LVFGTSLPGEHPQRKVHRSQLPQHFTRSGLDAAEPAMLTFKEPRQAYKKGVHLYKKTDILCAVHSPAKAGGWSLDICDASNFSQPILGLF
jgi:hypothetical protein